MPRITPHTYLRIAFYSTAVAVLCLLLLFLASTPLDPVIQVSTMVCYLVAILAMGGILRSHYATYLKLPTENLDTGPSESRDLQADTVNEHRQIQATTPQAPSAVAITTSIILLTKHDNTAREIEQNLSSWNHTLEVVDSCAEASQQILNRIPKAGATSRVTLIVDTQDLEMDPIHLPALIRQETALASLRLIGIVADLGAARTRQLRNAGFNALLGAPVDKSLLFTTITTQENHETLGANVVSLNDYRRTQKHQVKKRILLADQHAADRHRLAAFLRASGHRVKVVENGEQALNMLERQQFDVALINMQLTVMNGTQVIKLHRFTTPHPQWVNFIVMTDQTTPATLRLCRDLQVKACLFKPVPTDALLEIIDTTPMVTTPAPTTVRQASDHSMRRQETRFLHADLLDVKVLQALDQLDNDRGFVPDLISIFARDSVLLLHGLEDAVEYQNANRFIELSNILMDNAGQLGAFALYEMCLTLQNMSRHELNTTLATKLVRLRELIKRTNLAFQYYLNELENQHSDRS